MQLVKLLSFSNNKPNIALVHDIKIPLSVELDSAAAPQSNLMRLVLFGSPLSSASDLTVALSVQF